MSGEHPMDPKDMGIEQGDINISPEEQQRMREQYQQKVDTAAGDMSRYMTTGEIDDLTALLRKFESNTAMQNESGLGSTEIKGIGMTARFFEDISAKIKNETAKRTGETN